MDRLRRGRASRARHDSRDGFAANAHAPLQPHALGRGPGTRANIGKTSRIDASALRRRGQSEGRQPRTFAIRCVCSARHRGRHYHRRAIGLPCRRASVGLRPNATASGVTDCAGRILGSLARKRPGSARSDRRRAAGTVPGRRAHRQVLARSRPVGRVRAGTLSHGAGKKFIAASCGSSATWT